jgi:endonuclease YncB( thermonuclease family)
MAKVSAWWLAIAAFAGWTGGSVGGVPVAPSSTIASVAAPAPRYDRAIEAAETPLASARQTGTEVRVVGITDGDSLTVLTSSNEQIRVRLANVDAPEPGQPWGRNATRVLREIAAGQTVEMIETDQDRYGRTVADLYIGDRYINQELVEQGGAWAYIEHLRDSRFTEWEAGARSAGIGLWAMPPDQTVPPWEWRATRRAQAEQARQAEEAQRAFSLAPAAAQQRGGVVCGSKRLCREMSNCAEARAFLNECGLSRLDGDGDGVPCESLC